MIDSRLRVDHGTVELTLLVVAAAESSQEIAERLARDIHGRTGSNPRIEVIPLADAKAFATLETNLMARPVVTPEPPPPPSPMDGLELGTAALQQATEKRWPSQLGELLLISLDLGTAPYRIHLLSLGRAPDDATREVLGGAVASDLGREVSLSYTALPSEWIALEKSEQEYLDALRLQLLRGERSLQAWLCIERPAPKGDRGQLWPLEKKSLSQRVEDLVNGRERVALVEGEQHRFVFRKGGCGE